MRAIRLAPLAGLIVAVALGSAPATAQSTATPPAAAQSKPGQSAAGQANAGQAKAQVPNLAQSQPPATAQARPMQVIWSTFMRNYPSEHAMVIDEIAHDRIVDVLRCNPTWCEVVYGRAAGFIEAAALDGNIGVTSLRGPLDAHAGCFWIETPAYVGMRAQEICGVTHNPPALP
ncbi:MAG TPA: SH3 domain-containing protein [Acetobacteraceae bacterium]|nr:SH3 domain-containing protein [Acetobacteraceae bacterium]